MDPHSIVLSAQRTPGSSPALTTVIGSASQAARLAAAVSVLSGGGGV
jgi:hypothetical protein